MCVGAVVVDDDKMLLVRRGHGPAAGEWSIPGGRVEFGETLAEAVVREVAEETGVEVVCDELIGMVEKIHDDRHFLILDFRATALDPIEPTAGDDAAEAAWIPVAGISELRMVEGLVEFLTEHRILT